MEIHIDTSATGGSSDYEVTFKVQELGRITGSINTIIGNQEGSLLTGVKMPNMFGRGERFQVSLGKEDKSCSFLSQTVYIAGGLHPWHEEDQHLQRQSDQTFAWQVQDQCVHILVSASI